MVNIVQKDLISFFNIKLNVLRSFRTLMDQTLHNGLALKTENTT